MLLTHFLLAIDNLGLTLVVGIFSSIMTAMGVILAARYGWLGKREERLAARVTEVERREAICNDKVFKLRAIVTTLVVSQDIMKRACPGVAKEVEDTQARLHRQLEELGALDDGEEDEHTTKAS